MTIYEINNEIYSLIDEETGEITDFDKFLELNMAKEEKIENVALWVKELTAEATAIREEEKKLSDRRKAAENKAESLKRFLDKILEGNKFSTAKVAISFRKSEQVKVDESIFIEWAKEYADDLLTYAEPKINKTAIKEALASGREVRFAEITENSNIQIK